MDSSPVSFVHSNVLDQMQIVPNMFLPSAVAGSRVTDEGDHVAVHM
jgi:hypothetical protein